MKHLPRIALALALAISLPGCAEEAEPPANETQPTPAADQASAPGVLEVVARGLTFEAPAEIPSGWTTIRLRNESGMVHFAQMEKMPEGYGGEEQQTEVAPVFQAGYDLLAQGQVDQAMETFGQLPAWFQEIEFRGGPGLTNAGMTSQATVYLEPGEYLLECWVKTDDVFHSFNPDPAIWGMIREVTVTEAPSEAPEPSAELRITLSSEGGIELEGEPAPGVRTFAVEFRDQTVHENFLGHDVHLARIDADTDLDALGAWMDWSQPDGLETPAPVTFIGGINEMTAGSTGYFTATLEPGRYALVAEVTNPGAKGMLQTFTVEGPGL